MLAGCELGCGGFRSHSSAHIETVIALREGLVDSKDCQRFQHGHDILWLTDAKNAEFGFNSI